MSPLLRVLILCTGNSARSQMAEGLLRDIGAGQIEVFSAGTAPTVIRPEAVAVMAEDGIDISAQYAKHVDQFVGQQFDDVITVCDNARDSCPVFAGARRRRHFGFPDPAGAPGSDVHVLEAFRRVRDDLRLVLTEFADRALQRQTNDGRRVSG